MLFSPDFHPMLIAQKIRAAGVWWLRPAIQGTAQVVEAFLIEHYISILPLKLKNWVMCHQPVMLEEPVVLAETGAYLIIKTWEGQADHKHQKQTEQGPR